MHILSDCPADAFSEVQGGRVSGMFGLTVGRGFMRV
jgi:hypothetical protein